MIRQASRCFIMLVLMLTAVVICNSCATNGQQKLTKNSTPSRAEIDDFVAKVSSSSPEVSADLLIRIAQSQLMSNKKRKVALLEEAYHRASDAQKKLRMKRWTGLVDTASGQLSAAYDLELDELSIKTRAVRTMSSLNAARSRELFVQIPRLKLPPLSCADDLGYELSGFYKTLKEVQQKSFTPKEMSEGNGLRFIQPYIAEIESPAQVAPIVDLIVDSNLTSSEFSVLLSTLISALKGVQDDPKSFALSLTSGGLANSLQNLIKKSRDNDVASEPLLNAFRAYFLRELSVQCPDMRVGNEQKNPLQVEFSLVNKWFVSAAATCKAEPGRLLGSFSRQRRITFSTSGSSSTSSAKVRLPVLQKSRKNPSCEGCSPPGSQQIYIPLIDLPTMRKLLFR